MRWITNTTTMRERSRRASPRTDYSSTVLGRRKIGRGDQEEQRIQRASVGAIYHTRIRSKQHRSQSSSWARMLG